LDTGHKKQQHNTELVGWFVACFFKSHAAQQRHWFGQLIISHIKQQVVRPCNHTINNKSRFGSQNEKTELRGVFFDPF
jgi:putative Mn2+ efflux pump MntP